MWAIPFAYHTVIRQRATTHTDAGNHTVKSWATPDTLSIQGCNVQPMSAIESQNQTIDIVTDEWRLVTPPDADIVATDRVVWNATTYEVSGDPQLWADPLGGGIHHKQYTLRKVTG